MALPKPAITLLLILPAIVILLLQPDVGQTGLLLSLWGAMLFFAGLPCYWVGLMAGEAPRWAEPPMSSSPMCTIAWRNISVPPTSAIRRNWR